MKKEVGLGYNTTENKNATESKTEKLDKDKVVNSTEKEIKDLLTSGSEFDEHMKVLGLSTSKDVLKEYGKEKETFDEMLQRLKKENPPVAAWIEKNIPSTTSHKSQKETHIQDRQKGKEKKDNKENGSKKESLNKDNNHGNISNPLKSEGEKSEGKKNQNISSGTGKSLKKEENNNEGKTEKASENKNDENKNEKKSSKEKKGFFKKSGEKILWPFKKIIQGGKVLGKSSLALIKSSRKTLWAPLGITAQILNHKSVAKGWKTWIKGYKEYRSKIKEKKI